jgi:hypothetical protein
VGDDKKILTWNLEDLQTVDYGEQVPTNVTPEDCVLSKVNLGICTWGVRRAVGDTIVILLQNSK